MTLGAIIWYWGLPLLNGWHDIQAMTTRNTGPTLPTVTETGQPVQGSQAFAAVAIAVSRSPSASTTATTQDTPVPSPTLTATSIPATATPTSSPTAVPPTNTPTASPTETTPAGVTVLLMGIDARPTEGMLARTDTMMLARLDPQRHVVGFLSLPRDLWVSIPGYGQSKLNAAFYFGEQAEAGGGPKLARQTISNLLGIPIDYHVVINFTGFRSLIDAVGGVTVDVPRELYDPQFPTDDYGYQVAHFKAGVQTMDGERALMYCRTRHPDSDFERMRRQQQVLVAVQQRLRERGVLADLHHIDDVTGALRSFVHTDMPGDTVARLLWALRTTESQAVGHIAADTEYLNESNAGGSYTLVAPPGMLQKLGAALINGSHP